VGSSWEEKENDAEEEGFEMVPRRQSRHQHHRHEDSSRQTSSDEPEEHSSTESSRGHARGRKSHSPVPQDLGSRYSNSDLSSMDLSTPIHALPVPHTIGGSPRTVSRTAGYGSKVSPRQRVTVARGVYSSSSSSEDEYEVSVSDESLGSSEGEESRL